MDLRSMPARTGFMLALLCLLWLAGAGGCAAPEEAEPERADLRVAAVAGLDAVPLLVAAGGGFFAGEDLSVEPLLAGLEPELETLLQSGAADAAFADIFTLVRLQQQGFLFMGTSTCDAGRTLVTTLEKSGSFLALAGAAVAVSDNPDDLYRLELLLAAQGLEAGAVEIKAVPGPEEALDSFRRGAAAAAFLPRHLAAEALRAGAARLDPAPGEKLPGGVIIFSGEILQERQELAARFYRGYRAALRALNRDPQAYKELLVERWGCPTGWFEDELEPFALPRPLGRDEVGDALARAASGKEDSPEALPLFEALVFNGLAD